MSKSKTQSTWIEIPQAQTFSSRDEVYNIIKHLPLFKKRGREEVFLGIKKSKTKEWIGWEYIASIRNQKDFSNLLINSGLYELAINYWIISKFNGSDLNFETLMKQYDI